MTAWRATKARRVLAALLRIGWVIKRESSSHRTLTRPEWPDFVFAFHDNEEIGPKMLGTDRETDELAAGGSVTM